MLCEVILVSYHPRLYMQAGDSAGDREEEHDQQQQEDQNED